MTHARTTASVLTEAATRHGDAVAVIEGASRISYTTLLTDVRCAASSFRRHGISAGDVVAVWAPNCIAWIVAALGAQWLGAAVTPLNTRLKGLEAADQLRRSHARALVMARHFLGTDYPALLGGATLPDLDLRIILGEPPAGSMEWQDFLGAGDPADSALDAAPGLTNPELASDIIYTSGTTGAPKGVVCTHRQTCELFRAWSETVGLRPDDRYLIINPFFHTFGYKAGWLACLMTGAVAIPVAQFDIDATIALIERERVNFIPGPPTVFQSLLAANVGRKADFASLRTAVTGAAAVPRTLVERMRDELGFETVLTGYGMTECGAITMCRPGDTAERVATSCGRALPGLEIVCIDAAGHRLPPGSEGEILVRGYGVMRGYLDDPAATASAIDAEGWLHTGDVGRLDAEGYLGITDRKTEMYICGGFNCYPAEVERLLAANPKVGQAAVIGVPDERLGEVGRAFIVLRPGCTANEPEIIAWARQNMANYKVPRSVVFLATMPLNAAGKIMRSALRNPHVQAD